MPGVRVFEGAQLPQSKFWLDCALYTSSYQLKVVDCLLTNLHQPKTTHMVLTGQFAGVDLLMKAYASEDIQSCQFDMFGDCMLIIQDEG